MIGREDQRITVESFKGLYSRGSADEVPLDHAQDCLNLRFTSEGHLKTREGISTALTVGYSGGIRRFFLISAQPRNFLQPNWSITGTTEGGNLLILDNAHNLYVGNGATPIYHNDGMADFVALNVGNRVLISPTDGAGGFRQGVLQILDPFQNIIRDAAGPAPTFAAGSPMLAAISGTDGNVASGRHKIAVIYETDTGFWTPPGGKPLLSCVPTASTTDLTETVFACTAHGMVTGESHQITGGTGGNWSNANGFWFVTRIDDGHFSIPLDSHGFGAASGSFVVAAGIVPAEVVADGGHSIDVTGIPTGPSYVRKRILIATRAAENEYFFVPNVPGSLSVLEDNTTSTTTINFADTDLVASADYLFDVMEQVPSGGGICKYRGRIAIAGSYIPGVTESMERVYLSNIDDPETFNAVSGYVQVQTERDGNNVRNCFVLRDTLYMSKFVGTFATEDNGGNPSTWAVTIIDGVIGSYAYGASSFTASQPTPDTGDIILLASKSGLFVFDGVMRRPEISYKIQNLWLRINFNAFFRVTTTHDPWNHLVYITVPLDTATEPNTLLVCDYSDGRDHANVRWTVYQLPVNASCISMVYFGTSGYPAQYNLKIGNLTDTHLYALTDGQTADGSTIISSFYKPGPFSLKDGGINCYKILRFRARGVGKLSLQVTKQDDTGSVTPPYFTLATAPGRDYTRYINVTDEKINVKFSSGDAVNDYMIVDRLEVFGANLCPVRPSL